MSPSHNNASAKQSFLNVGGNEIEMSPSMRVKPRLSVMMPTAEQLEEARDLVKKLNKEKKEREKANKEKVEAQVKLLEIRRLEAELAEEERKKAEIDHKREQIKIARLAGEAPAGTLKCMADACSTRSGKKSSSSRPRRRSKRNVRRSLKRSRLPRSPYRRRSLKSTPESMKNS